MDVEEKWNAVINCVKDYDGLFYYGVKTTKIFCRPSCKAKTPLKKNTLFFNSIDEALEQGFRPCKMCRPDINSPSFDPNEEVIKKAVYLIDSSYNKNIDINSLAKELGLSIRHFVRLFSQYSGVTPNEYIKKLRIKKSKELLKDTDIDILDIGYGVGFKSVSNFYKCFKEETGTSPKNYRENNTTKE